MKTDIATGINQNEKIRLVRQVLMMIGEDPKRHGLLDTPKRVVKSWREIYGGYRLDPKKILTRRFEKGTYDQMILVRGIEFFSTCEHHMLPFFGRAHVAYIPDKHVVGLSKVARLVDCFARRLQIQERLTREIAEAMHTNLDAKGVGVMVEAKHFCMVCRGVQKQNSEMVTSALLGTFRDQTVREEFFALIRSK
jgi:GTP cyclohydrolase IA